jgi:hypothetical protein
MLQKQLYLIVDFRKSSFEFKNSAYNRNKWERLSGFEIIKNI